MSRISSICIRKEDVEKEEAVCLVSSKKIASMPREAIFLSNIDQALTFPVETLFFYHAPPGVTTKDISERVKRAVAETLLVPYYFMAGRLRFNEETTRLELVCNNAGALFVSATSRLMLVELGDLALPNSTFHHFLHRPCLYQSLAETPIFTLQVTRFACGGIALGFVTSHAILDGKSAGEMFAELASICRGETPKAKNIEIDRTCLKARNPPRILFPHKEYVKLIDIPPKTKTIFTPPDMQSPSPLAFTCQHIVHKLFSISPQMLSALKHKANTNCSTFEAIVAHIWRARTKALSPHLHGSSTLLFAVDIRRKMSPTLPKGFVGNAVVTAYATSSVKDLVERPYWESVKMVKEAIERVTDEYVRSVVDWLEVYRGIPVTGNGNFYVSAWWKLPFAELDFGFGKPAHGGPVLCENDEFVLLLSHAKSLGDINSDGINVWLGLEEEHMTRFMLHIFEI